MSEFERKTVFLYPSLENLKTDQLELTNNLIASMNFIVDSSNDLIRSILTGGNFSFIDYLPSVLLKSVNDENSSFKDCKNVRICIVGFNNIDYTDNYNHVIEEFKSGTSDISHLVAIHIVDNEKNPKFLYDDTGSFDVLIRTSIDDIENVLVSIMLDISLYHYFSLSSDLEKRKKFNIEKYKYLHDHISADEQKDTYGHAFDGKPIYLSLSLKNINKLSRRKLRESRSETIDELIKDFDCFVLSSLSYEIKCNNRGSILNPNIHRNNIFHFGDVQDYIRNHIDVQLYYILVPENMTNESNLYMIKYDHGIQSIKDWVEVAAKSGNYQIVKVVEEA